MGCKPLIFHVSMASLFTPLCLLDPCCSFKFSSIQLCYKSKRCSKNSHHVGKCDSKRVHREFWQKSVVYQIKSQQHKLARDLDNAETKKAEIQLAEQRLEEKQSEVECVVEIAEEKLESASKYLLVVFLTLPEIKF